MFRTFPSMRDATRAPSLVLPFVLFLVPAAALAQDMAGPATAVFITYDNSLSMDFSTSAAAVPGAVGDCDSASGAVERTRHIVASEALTGSYQDYCYTQVSREQTFGVRDDVSGYPDHTTALFSRQRRDGLLDVYADSVYFGLGTLDSLPSTAEDVTGDCSYGPDRGFWQPLNLGLANDSAPVGGLVSPLPADWVAEEPGALRSFRLRNNRRIQESIAALTPGLGSPIGAALDDVRIFRHSDAGVRNDPFQACRPFVHVLVTDGETLWDQCAASGESDEGLDDFPCTQYLLSSPPAQHQADAMAEGSWCADCPNDQPTRRIPTYVVAVGNTALSTAEEIAESGGTCALLDGDGNCIQHAFRADARTELIASLGTIFNRSIEGRISAVPPLRSTVALAEEVGLAQFRAGALVSQDSPYWTGTLSREVFTCEPTSASSADPTSEPTFDGDSFALTAGETLSFEDQFDADFVSSRNIYTARLDIAADGSSCEREDCPINSDGCFDAGAVPDPLVDPSLSGFGDGMGGVEGDALEVELDASTRTAIDNSLRESRSRAYWSGNDDTLPTPPSTVSFDALEIGDSCLIPFDVETLVDGQNLADALYAETEAEAVRTIEFVRGRTLSSLADLGLLDDAFEPALVGLHDRTATGYVGDFFHTQMALLDRPSPQDRSTPGYRAFVEAVGVHAATPRPYTLFAGSNDGMLHAFDALTGEETWAIIPPSFLPQLGPTAMSHRILVDGPVVVEDLLCTGSTGAETWCSLLAVSYGGGGSGAMVLDVTDPLAPRFLFEVTGQQIPELGLSYPKPLLGNMLVGSEIRPVLVLSGGRPLAGPQVVVGKELVGSHEGEVLVIMDALTGEIYRQFDPVSHGELFAQCGAVTGSPSGWSDSLTTRLFAGTQRGCLFRVDTSDNDPLQWTLELLYQTHSPGEIVFEPALAPRSDGTLVIVFGHGYSDEFEQINQNSNLVSINESRDFLTGNAATGQLGTFALGDATANWELQLETGEFLTAAPIVADGVVYAATWAPNVADPCTGGSALVYGIDYLGDPSVNGSFSTAPHLVEIDSERIVGRLDNPDYDPADSSSSPTVKRFGSSDLGAQMVVFGLEIGSVPDCSSMTALATNGLDLVATTTTRRLMVDGVRRMSEPEETSPPSDGADEGSGSDPQAPNDGDLAILTFEYDLPQPNIRAIPVDWGVVMEF